MGTEKQSIFPFFGPKTMGFYWGKIKDGEYSNFYTSKYGKDDLVFTLKPHLTSF